MIDTHAHIDDEKYITDFDSFINAQIAGGIEKILVPGINVESLVTVPQVCSKYPDLCLPALGIHPEEIGVGWQEQVDEIIKSVKIRKWVAVGEIGLDYHFDITYKNQQKEAFVAQLEIAIENELPVMIHCRDATEDCLNILKQYTSRGLRGVMHCFSGSKEVAVQIVRMGLYLGIGGVLTFKNSKLTDNLNGIPIERIVLETDSPYMAPVPYRGQRNEPIWMKYVIDKLRNIYNLDYCAIDRITTENAKLLFNL